MSRTQKEKLETGREVSLQIVTKNATEESVATAADNYIEITLEKRKKEAEKPLYLKRI